jgi:DHA2 family multidrug resistance protein-like MFS transporter
LILIVGPRLLPEFKDPAAGKLDLISAALSLTCVLLIIFGLKQIAEDGFDFFSTTSIISGFMIGRVFIRRQRKLTDPLMDLELFKGRSRVGMLLIMNTLAVFTTFGCYIFISQYLQLVLGLTPFVAGLWTLPWSLGFIVSSLITPKLSTHFRPTSIMATGLLMAALGFLILTQTDRWQLTSIVASSILFSVGLAPLFTLITDMILSAVKPERAGSAGALSETSSELGGALGIAVLGSIGTAVYRHQVSKGMPPQLSDSDAEIATNTLGGALSVSEKLTPAISSAIIDVARSAFTTGLIIMAVICAFLSLALAISVIITFRKAA